MRRRQKQEIRNITNNLARAHLEKVKPEHQNNLLILKKDLWKVFNLEKQNKNKNCGREVSKLDCHTSPNNWYRNRQQSCLCLCFGDDVNKKLFGAGKSLVLFWISSFECVDKISLSTGVEFFFCYFLRVSHPIWK